MTILRKTLALLLFILPLLCSGKLYAQQPPVYPVQLNVQLLPPYTPCLADYIAGDFDRLRVVALQRDLTANGYRFVLKFTVKQGNTVVMQTNPFQLQMDEFYVRPGVAATISGQHLRNMFNSIHYNSGRGLCLGEGYYELVFQAFDSYNPSIPVSDLSSTFVYFQKGQPPFLVSPADRSCVADYSPVINFSWVDAEAISRNNKTYRLEIYELQDIDIPNYKNIHRQQPIPLFTDDNIKMPFYSLPVTAAMFQSGKSYAWRVQVRNSDNENINRAAITNRGFSEMFLFEFGRCVDVFAKQPEIPVPEPIPYKPELIRITTTDYSAYAVWKNEYQYDDIDINHFNVEYRRKDDDMPREWVKLQGPRTTATDDLAPDSLLLNGINRGIKYEVRVQGIFADGKYSLYSDTKEFIIANERETLECGNDVPDLTSTENFPDGIELEAIYANGYKVTVTYAERNIDGSFSGTGTVKSPIFEAIPLKVKFDNIRVNAAKELTQGRIVTIYDIATSATLDLNGILNKGATGQVLSETPATFPKVIVNEHNIPLPKKYYNSVVQDNQGNVYVVNESGIPEKVGTINPDIKIEKGSYSPNSVVTFTVGDDMIFDEDAGEFAGRGRVDEYYETLKGGGSSSYKVPWTFVATGQKRFVMATVVNGSFNENDIKFVTTGNVVLEHRLLEDGRFEVTVFGGSDRTSQGVYAVVQSGTSNNYSTIGKIKLAHYQEETLEVVIVPVKVGDVTIAPSDKTELENRLNDIYNPVGIKINLTVDAPFEVETEDLDLTNGLKVDNSGFWTNETDEMKQLKFLYAASGRELKKSTVYLFALEKANPPSVKGDMPRGKRTGYIFGSEVNNARLIAHELGHGAFSLEHTFGTYGLSAGDTDNLMDYSTGSHLTVWQWDLVHNPRPVWSFLDSEEEGLIMKTDENLMNEIVQKLRCAYATSVRKIQITIPVSKTTSSHVKAPGIDLYATPKIYSSTGGYYEEFTLNATFEKIYVGSSCTFKFAERLSITVATDKAVEFENYLLNSNFNADVLEIEKLVNEKKPILEMVYNSSICTLKNLSANALVQLIDELSKRSAFTEGYENLLLNVMRAAKSDDASMNTKQKVISEIFKNFKKFEKDMDNANGLPNYDNFIYELSDLHRIVYGTQTEIDNSVPLYVWEDTWTDMFRKVAWDSFVSNKYSFYSDNEKKRNYIVINYNLEKYYFNPSSRTYDFYPENMIYVYLNGDIGIAPKGEILRMPAFQLAFLLKFKRTELLTKVANMVFTPVSLLVGAAELKGASWLYKLWYSYTVGKFVLEDMFSVGYKEYIRNQGPIGINFVFILESVEDIVDLYDAAKGFRYTVEDLRVMKGFFDSWGLLYEAIKNDQKPETERVNNMINKLKEDIGYDDKISY